jgi:hypothetical protein
MTLLNLNGAKSTDMRCFTLVCGIFILRQFANKLVADHVEWLGPAMTWWAIPMERYIGELKGMVGLMSNMDANLANKVITAEHLNHLPPTDLLYTPSSLPKHDEPFPFAAGERMEYRKKPPSDVLKALRHRFRAARLIYSVKEGDDLVLWTKYHLR